VRFDLEVWSDGVPRLCRQDNLYDNDVVVVLQDDGAFLWRYNDKGEVKEEIDLIKFLRSLVIEKETKQ